MPGCATGCNIEVQQSRNQIYRLVPRAQPAVNKHWMCDEGRFTYKRVQTQRLAAPLSSGAPVDWDRALDDAGERCAPRSTRAPPGRRRVQRAVDQRRSLRAGPAGFDHLRVGRAYLAGLDQGWSDDILVSADKNPNTAGAMAIGAGRLPACSIWQTT